MKSIYRVLAPILCVLLIPVIIFLPMIRMVVSSALGGSNILSTYGLGEFISIKDVIVAVTDEQSATVQFFRNIVSNILTGDNALGDSIVGLKGYAITFVVFLALMLISALVLAGFAIFTKKLAVCNILNVVSIVSCFAMKTVFGFIAKPFLSGEISLGSLANGSGSGESAGLLSGIMNMVAKVDTLQLSYFYQVCILILVGTLILGIAAAMDHTKKA